MMQLKATLKGATSDLSKQITACYSSNINETLILSNKTVSRCAANCRTGSTLVTTSKKGTKLELSLSSGGNEETVTLSTLCYNYYAINLFNTIIN